jgi:predicted SAM-dependent methyltransferase
VEGLGSVILNVGCGRFPVAGAVNVDCVALPTVDVVHDLDVTPWPFNDAAFHEVRGVQVFEHVRNPIGFMCESWRVLKPGGLLFLAVPHYQSENAFTDPTHVRFCTEHTWDYWIDGAPLNRSQGPQFGGDRCRFASQRIARVDDDIHVRLIKL